MAARGIEEQCDYARYFDYCWSSETQYFDKTCWFCKVRDSKISHSANLTVSGDRANVSHAGFEYVRFVGGSITKMPLILQKNTNKDILQVQLFKTKTKVLNAQFFEHSSKNLTFFGSTKNNLFVEADAFENWTSLEILGLADNKLISIPPSTFSGLSKLVRLDLETNWLDKMEPEWFLDLLSLEQLDISYNSLTNIQNDIFNTLTMLKILHLQDNKIRVIRRRMFHQNKELEVVYLANNLIKKIHQDSFSDLTKLTRLGLTENICASVDFENIENIEAIHEDLAPCYAPNCVIPDIENGHVVSIKDNATQTPGDSLETFHSAKVVCEPNYLLHNATESEVKCLVDDWQDQEWAECHSERSFRIFYIHFDRFYSLFQSRTRPLTQQ